MSKFKIYTSKGISFKRIERLNKAFYILSAFIPLVGLLVFTGEKLNFPIYFPVIVIILWILIVIALILFSRFVNKSLENIGYLTLTASTFQKSIGDFIIQKKYDEIRELKIKKHLGSLLFPSNLDGSKTYLLSIMGNDRTIEQMVVSSDSVDKPIVNFYDLLKKIQKRTRIKLSS